MRPLKLSYGINLFSHGSHFDEILMLYYRSVKCHMGEKGLSEIKESLLTPIFAAWVATVQPSARWLYILVHPDQEICSTFSTSKEIKPSIWCGRCQRSYQAFLLKVKAISISLTTCFMSLCFLLLFWIKDATCLSGSLGSHTLSQRAE